MLRGMITWRYMYQKPYARILDLAHGLSSSLKLLLKEGVSYRFLKVNAEELKIRRRASSERSHNFINLGRRGC